MESQKIDSEDEIGPSDSVSQASHSSFRSGSSSRSKSLASERAAAMVKEIQLAAKAALLKKRREMEKQQQEIDEQQRLEEFEAEQRKRQMENKKVELQYQHEELTLQTELETARAVSEVYRSEEEKSNSHVSGTAVRGAISRQRERGQADSEVKREQQRPHAQPLSHDLAMYGSSPYSYPHTAAERIQTKGTGDTTDTTHQGLPSQPPPGMIGSAGVNDATQELLRQQSQLTKLLVDQQVRASLPHRSIPVYDGDPLEFVTFIRAFESGVEEKTDSDSERMYYLEQFTSGEPNLLVKGLLHKKQGYKDAKRLLTKKFGNKYVISSAFQRKAASWPEVKAEDTKGWNKLSSFLTAYYNTMQDLKSLGEVDHSACIRNLLSKLSYGTRNQWRVLVTKIEEKEERMAGFKEFVDFIERQARVLSNPVYGNISEDKPKTSRTNSTPVRRKAFATTVQQPTKPKTCIYCEAKHSILECNKFRKLDRKKKSDFCFKEGLCFGCLKKGHNKVNCRNTEVAKCEICDKNHPSILHHDEGDGDKTKSKKDSDKNNADSKKSNKGGEKKNKDKHETHTTTGYAAIPGAGDSLNSSDGPVMTIIPVLVKTTTSSQPISTYAFMDNGCGAVFALKSLPNIMNARTKPAKLILKTMNLQEMFETQVTTDPMQVGDIHGENFIDLPSVFLKEELPVTIEDVPKQTDLDKWEHLMHIKLPKLTDNCIPRVSLMIGSNVPAATMPLEIVCGRMGEPYAVKSPLGWLIYGLPGKFRSQHHTDVNFCRVDGATVQTGLEHLEQQLTAYFNHDFTEQARDSKREMSVNDKRFMKMMEDSTEVTNGHYQVVLPFKDRTVPVPNNRAQAELYAKRLGHRLKKNKQLHEQYTEFMTNLEDKEYCERVPEAEVNQGERIWYIPHHPVLNPHKPDKVRVVFNCPIKYHGFSLNDQLLQGPDLTNQLQGVLLRWRKQPVAMMADVESMFYQVRVNKSDCNMLRYLWWPDGDLSHDPVEYRMLVHLFGAVSSPSCANYALKRTAKDYEHKYECDVTEAVKNDFYVDDLLKSVASEEEGVKVADSITQLLAERGFRLHKWVSNSRHVIESIPLEDRATDVKELDLDHDNLPTERALGVQWEVQNDKLIFSHKEVERIPTRRNILSVVSGLYDPLGMVAPFTLRAKLILQEMCRKKAGWDEEAPPEQRKVWESWTKDLKKLKELKVDRCLKPDTFVHPMQVQLHHFADASNSGYGVVTYIRYVKENRIHCAFVMAKARVCPLKKVTIPRLELNAARVAVRVDIQLHRELKEDMESFFWTDSETVLKYLNNNTARFHTFVANRVQEIQETSQPSQWRYVPSESNPADDCSRGLTMDKLLDSTRWFKGPTFLWKEETEWPQPVIDTPIVLSQDDPEVKRSEVQSTETTVRVGVARVKLEDPGDPVNMLINYFSSWKRLRRSIAWWLRWKRVLQQKAKKQVTQEEPKYLTVEELQSAEQAIIAVVQHRSFHVEIAALQSQKKISHNSNILSLDPMLRDGLLRVGGRLHNANIPEDAKHPMILPKDHHVSELILNHVHQQCNHQGRNHTLAKVRQKYWIVSAGVRLKKILKGCVVCRRQRCEVGTQKMADLPPNRVHGDQPPFSSTGMDYFGPFEIRQGRVTRKRYGVIFTCMATRAIHIEIADSLDTSSCINALRRFICRRGQVREIISDNGTNLVGANKELRQSIRELDAHSIQKFNTSREINWRFNPPGASHHGGAWERHIRSIRKILQSMLTEQHLKVAKTEDQLHTLMCEVEATLNSRPLTRASEDPDDLDVLTPNHLLQLQTPVYFPPGVFDEKDAYTKRRWRQVQYMADLFWKRWVAEYLPLLQKLQKWLQQERNLKVGDIVLIIDSSAPRNSWAMGKVEKVNLGNQGLVRSATVKTKSSTLLRPISKLCLLLEQEGDQQLDTVQKHQPTTSTRHTAAARQQNAAQHKQPEQQQQQSAEQKQETELQQPESNQQREETILQQQEMVQQQQRTLPQDPPSRLSAQQQIQNAPQQRRFSKFGRKLKPRKPVDV